MRGRGAWDLLRLPGRGGIGVDDLRPDEPFVAVGDVHGCLRELDGALGWADRHHPGARVVILGDVVDRGPDSAGALRRLCDRARADPRLVCLLGNHDAMLLKALDAPAAAGAAWLRMGARATLESFGLRVPAGPVPEDSFDPMMADLRDAMGGALIDWIRRWPTSWRSGNVVAAHAGLDPRRPPEAQDEQTLLWGAPGFPTRRRRDGLIVVHGHIVVGAPSFRSGRVALDTGAYATGRLSAAHLAPGALEFRTSGPDDGQTRAPGAR